MTEFQFPRNFQNLDSFAQAAFDYVGKVVGQYGEQILISGSCSFDTEKCLIQLELVCSTWGLDNSKIRALADIFTEENANLKEMLIELGDHDD